MNPRMTKVLLFGISSHKSGEGACKAKQCACATFLFVVCDSRSNNDGVHDFKPVSRCRKSIRTHSLSAYDNCKPQVCMKLWTVLLRSERVRNCHKMGEHGGAIIILSIVQDEVKPWSLEKWKTGEEEFFLWTLTHKVKRTWQELVHVIRLQHLQTVVPWVQDEWSEESPREVLDGVQLRPDCTYMSNTLQRSVEVHLFLNKLNPDKEANF
jgi:hypothetical protein